jgi:hypothetical protein
VWRDAHHDRDIAVVGTINAGKPSRRVGALLDLFFAASSTPRADDIHCWQAARAWPDRVPRSVFAA